MLAALTFLPALLLVGGRRSRAAFWPRRPRYVAPEETTAEQRLATQLGRAGVWTRVADFVTAHARPVWMLTAVVLLVGVAFVPTLRADGTSETDIFLTEVEAVTGEQVLAEHFDEGTVHPAFAITREEAGEEVLAAAEGVDGVLSAALVTADDGGAPAGPAGVGGSGAGADPVVVDGRVQVEVVTEDAAETQAALETVAALRAAVHQVDADALVGGAAAERLDTQETAARDLRTIIPVVLGVIFVMLVLLLRAIVAPLVLLGANLLSFGATMGLSALVFNHVLGFPGADATVPLYGFVFLVALGIDYSIFLMARVREESVEHGTRVGVHHGLAVTGGVITSAGLVLAATFSALAVIPLLFPVQLAFIVAVGVLIDTFVVRTLLVPGVIHDIGRSAWWPWQRRISRD